jgi:hypothetical protein
MARGLIYLDIRLSVLQVSSSTLKVVAMAQFKRLLFRDPSANDLPTTDNDRGE